VVNLITQKYAQAKKPMVLVDACAARFGVGRLVRELVEKCGIRFFTTPMGKGILDERHPLFGGCYAGSNSLPPVKDELESSDFVLYVGALKSDFNSGSFTVGIPTEHAVRLHSFTTNVGYAAFPTTDIRHVLPLLLPAFQKVKGPPALQDSLEDKITAGRVLAPKDTPDDAGGKIVHAWLWQRMASWFKDHDVIITETGTSSFGLLPVPLPSRCTYVTQVLWGSIGWSVGAALGCALAAHEQGGRRTVLFVGDGSFQLTAQELGTIVRRGVPAYIFVLNNDGYEIERRIHGKHARYNDIQAYDLQMALPFLGGQKANIPYESLKVTTQGELQKLLDDPAFAKADKVRLIELVMPRDDAPAGLIKQAELTAKANAE
jgi:pyruvate decarboxylase